MPTKIFSFYYTRLNRSQRWIFLIYFWLFGEVSCALIDWFCDHTDQPLVFRVWKEVTSKDENDEEDEVEEDEEDDDNDDNDSGAS